MKTANYNPSKLEVELAKAIAGLQTELSKGLESNTITSIVDSTNQDNPRLLVKTQDVDGDPHEVVIRIIQRPDNF